MTNTSASYKHLSCVFTHCLSVIPLYLFILLRVCRCVCCVTRFSLLRINLHSNYEMCRFRQWASGEARERDARVFVLQYQHPHVRLTPPTIRRVTRPMRGMDSLCQYEDSVQRVAKISSLVRGNSVYGWIIRKYSFYILILLKINEYMFILRSICGEFLSQSYLSFPP